MIIKEISTERFAGICNKTDNNSIKLNPGINIVYGKNETGKSTLVNLISSTLFQEKRDKSFEGLFFPTDGKSDTIYGTLKIEKDGETFTLERKWKKGSTSSNPKLTSDMNKDVNTTDSAVQENINKILGYGKGVYTELLLSPQKDAADNLKYLLDGKDNSKTSRQELAAVVTQALGETGGYSMSEFEKAVEAKIYQLTGEYWDIDNNRPREKTSGGRYVFAKTKTDAELLRRSYYALEDAKSAKEAQEELKRRAKEKTDAENKHRNFLLYKGQIELLKANDRKAKELELSIGKAQRILEVWPGYKEDLKKAVILEAELSKRDLLDKFLSAKAVRDTLDEVIGELNSIPYPEEEEITIAENADNTVKENRRKLMMELSAKIKMMGGHSVVVKSIRTGEELDINAPITEAVSVEIPGVMEMTLAPADVDADAIKKEITENEAIRNRIFEKYRTDSVRSLRELAEQKRNLEREKAHQEKTLSGILGDKEYSILEKEAAALGAVREKSALAADILDLCNGKSVRDFIVEKETVLSGYESDYTSPGTLSEKIKADTVEMNKVRESADTKNIPREYLVNNAEDDLEQKRNSAEEAEEKAQKAFQNALVQLSNLYTGYSDDLQAAKNECERIFNERKNELENWLHIQKAYEEIKDSAPYKDLAEKFAENLGVISGDKDKAECSGDTLDFRINDSIGYGLLSEGTKETAYLAFRLAVLEHLFPDGGGVIVLDDPLNDMDKDRVEKSCELIRKCAEKHQVILLTCREDYSSPLGVKGKEIRLS